MKQMPLQTYVPPKCKVLDISLHHSILAVSDPLESPKDGGTVDW